MADTWTSRQSDKSAAGESSAPCAAGLLQMQRARNPQDDAQCDWPMRAGKRRGSRKPCQRRRQRRPPCCTINRRTVLCKEFPKGTCTFGEHCNFAHSVDELRTVDESPNYRSRMCEDYLAGFCKYGDRCFFLHDRPCAQQNTRQTTEQVVQQVAHSADYEAAEHADRYAFQHTVEQPVNHNAVQLAEQYVVRHTDQFEVQRTGHQFDPCTCGFSHANHTCSWNNAQQDQWNNAQQDQWNNARQDQWNNARQDQWNNARQDQWNNARQDQWNNARQDQWNNARQDQWNNARQGTWQGGATKAWHVGTCNEHSSCQGSVIPFAGQACSLYLAGGRESCRWYPPCEADVQLCGDTVDRQVHSHDYATMGQWTGPTQSEISFLKPHD
jgi:hypothetical protein